MKPFERFEAPIIVLDRTDIDTDQIIPARFLKATDKKGFGDNVFRDWRFDSDGNPTPDFPLNAPEYKKAQVLVAGEVIPLDDGRIQVNTRLWDIYGSEQLASIAFKTPADNWRRAAHKVSDFVYKTITGEDGYFDTRVEVHR